MRTPQLLGGLIGICFALVVASPASQASAQEAKKPNIVFIMADDLGNSDLGYRGGRVITPNIDKLATNGVRLNRFMANRSARPRARP